MGPPSRTHGVTLTELAAALAATVIIGAVGVSAYRTHAVRTEIARVIEAADPTKERVVAAFHSLGMPPRDATEAGIPANALHALGGDIDALAVIDGRIEVTFGNGADSAIAGERLSLTPFETVVRDVVWVCGNQIPGLGLEPLGFAGGARQAVQVLTTVDARYLPASCR